jgi:hypothetical protein
MLYIDTSTYDDYDRVARYLIENKVPIVKRNKMAMVIGAEVSGAFVAKMIRDVKFDDIVTYGEELLDPNVFDE